MDKNAHLPPLLPRPRPIVSKVSPAAKERVLRRPEREAGMEADKVLAAARDMLSSSS